MDPVEHTNPTKKEETPEQLFVRLAHERGQALLPGTIAVAVDAMKEYHKREMGKIQINDE